MELRVCVGLEFHIFDQESPHLITEAIGLEMTLESESCFHFVCEYIGNRLVKVEEDLHCKLRLNTSIVDQFVDSIDQAVADAIIYVSPSVLRSSSIVS